MSLEEYKANIKSFIGAREKCTPGPVVMGAMITENDLQFCIQAMDHAARIAEDLLLAIEALEHLANKNYAATDNGRNYMTSCACTELYSDKPLEVWATETLSKITGGEA